MTLFGQSPMSTLSASIRGGLAPGQLGVVMARRGVGKSAFLVHIALGHLVRSTEVLHVSLQDAADHVRSFYDEIFRSLRIPYEPIRCRRDPALARQYGAADAARGGGARRRPGADRGQRWHHA